MAVSCGIYRIKVATPRGHRFYVGQAIDLPKRKYQHFRALALGKHKNRRLQNAFNKYGIEKFDFETILICNRSDLLMYEQAIVDFYLGAMGAEGLLNILTACVNSRAGVPVSEETRAAMRVSAAGRAPSEVCRQAAKLANTGRKLSPESIAKRTLKQKGIKRRPETKLALSIALSGKKRSPETCARISASRIGWKPSTAHIEHLRKLGNSDANRARMAEVARGPGRLAKIGKKKSAEEIARRTATRRLNAAKAVQHG